MTPCCPLLPQMAVGAGGGSGAGVGPASQMWRQLAAVCARVRPPPRLRETGLLGQLRCLLPGVGASMSALSLSVFVCAVTCLVSVQGRDLDVPLRFWEAGCLVLRADLLTFRVSIYAQGGRA